MFQKLTVSNLAKKYLRLTEPQCSLPRSQKTEIFPYLEPDECSLLPHPASHIAFKIHFNTLQSTPGFSKWSLSYRFSHQTLYVFLFLTGFPTKPCMYTYFSSPLCAALAAMSSSSRDRSHYMRWAEKNREASHYTSFSSPLTFQSSHHLLSASANLLWNVAKPACVSGGHRATKMRSLVYTEFKEKSQRKCMHVERLRLRSCLSTSWRRIGGSRCVAPLIYNFDPLWRWVVSLINRLLFPRLGILVPIAGEAGASGQV
jgi:hypothetical protein